MYVWAQSDLIDIIALLTSQLFSLLMSENVFINLIQIASFVLSNSPNPK